MRATLLVLAGVLAAGSLLLGDENDLKARVAAAVQNLADQPSYGWNIKIEAERSGPFGGGGGATSGQRDKDGYLHVSMPMFDGNVEFVTKAGKSAILVEENWQTPQQAASRGAKQSGLFNPAAILLDILADFKPPPSQLKDILAKATDFRRDGETVKATLRAETIADLLNSDPLSRLRRPRGKSFDAPIQGPKGSVTIWIKGGAIGKYAVALSGRREINGNVIRLDRVTTTTFTGIGNTKVELHPDAKEIVDAQIDGRSPKVFVPEPGFKKLFNGRNLTGWAGRAGHWSVEDGAITGRTTKANPAKGNNFLIAKRGDKSLIVDDFQLRLSYKITANNKSGFANSGVQYRSLERPNYVAAGYQADVEAGPNFSGILYDEAGGAGGRGIMAQRGEAVVWNAEGKKQVTGRLGKSADIQKGIKKDDWNEYVIIAEGNHLQHFINGVQAVDVIDDTPSKRLLSGILALQLHAGEPMTVQFKDIRIKSLRSAAVLAAGNLNVAKGFQLEQIYTVPRLKQGSWVALCVDPKGRLIAADQNGTLYRLTLPPLGQSAAVKVESLAVQLSGAHGLLYAFGSLYVMVNERGQRGLYRLRDSKGNDQFDEVRLLRKIPDGGGEHGVHALVLSPDGKSIYVVCGNSTPLTKVDSSRLPLNWSEDNLVPRIPTGFMDNSLAPQGWIARTDPEGQKWELIAAGMRNPFDIAFNHDGELFTYDADMEWDIGEPWYRPTRINHVISGAEFGFRNGSGKWPDYYLDSFGAVVNVGPGSPTGITFGYGAKFPAKYQEALFICDWSFGKLRAVHLTPAGASYTAEVEDFISGQPLPLCDVVINPKDGAMYFVVGGRGTQSAVYRVTYVGKEPVSPGKRDLRFQEQRNLRHLIEGYHGHQCADAVDAVWPYLGDQDRAIRYAARIALEWQDPAQWRNKALAERDARKAIAALVALARVSGKDSQHRKTDDPKPEPELQGRLLAALEALDSSALSTADRLDLLRAYALVFTRLGQPQEADRRRLIEKLEPQFPSTSREVNALLANLLVYLQAPKAAPKIMAAMRAARTQEEQIDYALVLRELKTGWTMPLREEYFRWFATTASTFRGGNTFAAALRTIKSQAVAKLSDKEKSALKPILEAEPLRKSPRELLAARRVFKKWTLDELLPIAERGLRGGRDLENGRRLYSEVACAACHRFDNDGGSVGPDLSALSGRFGVRDILESILEPSKVISDQYAAINIVKTNGKVVTGRIANLSGESVDVVEDMLEPGRPTKVRRSDIETMEMSKVSMMPEGLLDSLNAEEVLDLLAYLLSRSDRGLKPAAQSEKDKLPAPGTTGNPENVPFVGKNDPHGNPVRLAKATGHVSNYSEDQLAPYTLPHPLVMSDKRRVATAEMWFEQRRPEILKFFRDEIYGAVPANAPKVTWEVAAIDDNARQGTAIMRRIVGTMGNGRDGPRMNLTVFTPAKANGPVPVLLNLTFAMRSGGRTPGGFDLVAETLSRGWGYAALGYTDIQPDMPNRWNEGAIGLTLRRGQIKPDANEWGTISAWAWGLSRAIDYFETDKSVNAKQIAISGASRLGKTVLWVSAQDERVAAVFAAVPGEMGASLIRRDWGETLDDMAERFGYQFASNLQKWVGRWNELAVDQHMLIALSAPRPVLVSGGIKDQWSDPKGQFLALMAAGPVYRLLGAKDLCATQMPALDKPVADGSLAYHYQSSGHTVLPADWKLFFDFADRHYKAATKQQSDNGRSK